MDTSDQRATSDPTLTAGSPEVGDPLAPDEPPAPDGVTAATQGSTPGEDDAGASRPRRSWSALPWRMALRTGGKVGVVAALVVGLSVVLGGVAFVAAGFYGQYGAVRNAPNATAWAALAPRAAGAAACSSCHAPQATAQDASVHADVSCESCHGPAAVHAASAEAAETTDVVEPTSAICVTCHAATPGRPAGFAVVDPDRHYRGGECLRCHDPHSVTALRPPIVTHPLARLPACIACHKPDGLKAIPAGHEPAADSICLSCHGRTAKGLPD